MGGVWIRNYTDVYGIWKYSGWAPSQGDHDDDGKLSGKSSGCQRLP